VITDIIIVHRVVRIIAVLLIFPLPAPRRCGVYIPRPPRNPLPRSTDFIRCHLNVLRVIIGCAERKTDSGSLRRVIVVGRAEECCCSGIRSCFLFLGLFAVCLVEYSGDLLHKLCFFQGATVVRIQ